jgi:hypothetical protein
MRSVSVLLVVVAGCMSPEPGGLLPSQPADTTVLVDLFARPLPELPLPNDLATRGDISSATGRRVNASMVAPTHFESRTRQLLDTLDGWGIFQPITIPFTGPIDVDSILAGHRDPDYDPRNDVIYLINVDRDSPHFGRIEHLDLGNGNYPVVIEKRDNYWKNDVRVDTMSLFFEEINEDTNGNGLLDPGEDTDADGVLDFPNYIPGANPDPTDLAARADALMSFYESQTNTVIARPMVPLDERTTYAVVLTRRLLDAGGQPVGSPYAFINHTSQTRDLYPLLDALPEGLAAEDIAFTFSFTTQSVESSMVAVRDGLYGLGTQAHLGAEFPAVVASLEPLREAGAENPYIIYGEEWRAALEELLVTFNNDDPNSEELEALLYGIRYIDYFVIGSFESPQLFPREGGDGTWLGLDDQSWPADLDRVPAPARSERVYFTMSVPRKEISARGEGEQVPVVLQGHGYTSSRFEGMQLAGFFARYGVATLAMEAPSHGLAVNDIHRVVVNQVLGGLDLRPMADAILHSRAHNQDHDPLQGMDTGADFWTSYLFHTRDVVRQATLDFMQAVRILRSFDGSRRWAFDVNGDGQNELAGDFDADGIVDVGVDSTLNMVGGSLGGMMSMMVGSLEPQITSIAPLAGGGGLTDIGVRTRQGGAVEGFILRSMGPLYAATLDTSTGRAVVETLVPDLNDETTLLLATIDGASAGDTMVVENLRSGERGCGYFDAQGRARASVASDVEDPTRILFYTGEALILGDTECTPKPGASPYRVVDAFETDVTFQYDDDGRPNVYVTGEPLVALAEGLGLRRADPDFRRFLGLGQLVLDAGDPASFARHLSKEPLVYGTGERTGTHALVITTEGDPSVPPSSGLTFARAAGLVDYLEDDPRFRVPANQVLLDNYVAEGVNTLLRFTDSQGNGVHIDVENLSLGSDVWGSEIPRLDPPLHLGIGKTDPLGGESAALFVFPRPDGEHGFARPGGLTDRVRRDCQNACTLPGTDDPCGCATLTTFDIGHYMFSMMGRYLASGGTVIDLDQCQATMTCPDQTPPPADRDVTQLP